jgi:hypothetical protein
MSNIARREKGVQYANSDDNRWASVLERRNLHGLEPSVGTGRCLQVSQRVCHAVCPAPTPLGTAPSGRGGLLKTGYEIDYELQREAVAKGLGIRVSALDKFVQEARGGDDSDRGQGRVLSLPEPEASPEPVEGATLLDALVAHLRRYVVLMEGAAEVIALWIVHTYLLDNFGTSPRLAITSPEKNCEKTTLLDVIARLVWRPLPTADASTAAVFRVVEMKQPTLLIDEADTFLRQNDELRGILNSGHRRGGSVIRTVGEDHEPRKFSTYSACAIAMIGRLPGTLADRSVPIELRRRRADEPIEPFRFDRTADLDELARKVARWAKDNAGRLGADPEMPDGVFNRVEDNWRPLLAIADAAGGEWPARAREALECAIDAADGDDQSVRVQLLSDIRAIFAKTERDRLSSTSLVDALVAIEDRPWAEWGKTGKPLTKNGLARLLKSFKVEPKTIRVGDKLLKGYRLSHLKDAFERYLQP